jgi:Zn-dependent M28 family amino/carboxypeptidase
MNRDLAERLRAHVEKLAVLGEKSTRRPASLRAAAEYIEKELEMAGLTVHRQTYDADGVESVNLDAAVLDFSAKGSHLLIGAHYDSAYGTPGADDNCSAVALLIELARHFVAHPRTRELRFAAFANEEPPHFHGGTMGSLVFAQECRKRRDGLRGMICLESLGVYSDDPRTQALPSGVDHLIPEGFRADVGNFVALIDDGRDAGFFTRFCSGFVAANAIPALPATLPYLGVSDHWSFWQCAYPAVMLTDTAMYRNEHYHAPTDTPEKLDYSRMAAVFAATCAGIERLLRGGD